MDTHQKLMYTVIALAAVHALLSLIVLFYDSKMSMTQKKIFLSISIVVNIAIAICAYFCLRK